MIQLAELFAPGDDHKIRVASQIGITHAIIGVAPALSRVERSRYVETLRKIKAESREMLRQPDGGELPTLDAIVGRFDAIGANGQHRLRIYLGLLGSAGGITTSQRKLYLPD